MDNDVFATRFTVPLGLIGAMRNIYVHIKERKPASCGLFSSELDVVGLFRSVVESRC